MNRESESRSKPRQGSSRPGRIAWRRGSGSSAAVRFASRQPGCPSASTLTSIPGRTGPPPSLSIHRTIRCGGSCLCRSCFQVGFTGHHTSARFEDRRGCRVMGPPGPCAWPSAHCQAAGAERPLPPGRRSQPSCGRPFRPCCRSNPRLSPPRFPQAHFWWLRRPRGRCSGSVAGSGLAATWMAGQ